MVSFRHSFDNQKSVTDRIVVEEGYRGSHQSIEDLIVEIIGCYYTH